MHSPKEMVNIEQDLKDALENFRTAVSQTKAEVGQSILDTDASTDFNELTVHELKKRTKMYIDKSFNEFKMSYSVHSFEERLNVCINNKLKQDSILEQCRGISNKLEYLKQQNFDGDNSNFDKNEHMFKTFGSDQVNYEILLNTSRMNLARSSMVKLSQDQDRNHTGLCASNETNQKNLSQNFEKLKDFKSEDFDLAKAFEDLNRKSSIKKAVNRVMSNSNILNEIKPDSDEIYCELLDQEVDSSSSSDDAIINNSKQNLINQSFSGNQIEKSGVKSNLIAHYSTLMKKFQRKVKSSCDAQMKLTESIK